MSELHRLYRSSHMVLPPSLMYGKDARTFWCTVYGSTVPFKISVHLDADVNDLKKDITRQEVDLRDIPYSRLVLHKLNVPEPVDPEDTLWQRIRKRGDVGTFSNELKISTQKMSTIFPQLPLENNVYILLELPPNDSRSWLAVIHHKLWREHEFFGKIFRTANLTEHDFEELQDLLDKENPERISDSSEAKSVLVKKSDFLRKRSESLITDFGNGLVPRPVFDATQPPSSDIVDNDDAADDDDDVVANDADHGYVDSHKDHLSDEATAIFPCTIRYVDLTVLNLKNDLRVPFLMLFRNEWGSMIKLFNERRGLGGIRGSAVFTGQPGIGKTCLLYSILILCMIRGQPFVFQDMYGKVFIIDDNGVARAEDAPTLWGEVDEVLTLVDANTKCFIPDPYLLNNSKHCILLTSSPRDRSDRSWLKQYHRQNAVFTMMPWSRQELVVATLFLHMTDITLKRLQKVSLVCGNIPRPCLEAAASPTGLREAEKTIETAIKNTKDLFKVSMNMQDGNSDKTIHCAFQVHPGSSEDRFWDSCVTGPVSAWAFSKMLDVLHEQNRNEAFNFYSKIKGISDSSQLCGKVFENYLHPFLKSSRTFIIKSLDDRAATLKIDFTVTTDNHLSFTDLSQELELSVQSNTSRYLRPESPVYPSFDSFLYQPNISHLGFSPLVALQVTTADEHDIKVKGLNDIHTSLKDPCFKNIRPIRNRKMIILFVVPMDLEKNFKAQKIKGAKAAPWYNKTTQYVLGLPEEDLFKCYRESVASKGKQS